MKQLKKGFDILNTIIVEQDFVYRKLLCTQLEVKGIDIIFKDKSISEISRLYREYYPNLFILVIDNNFQQSIESIEYLMHEYPFAKVIVLTKEIEDFYVKEIIRIGVKGLVLKSSGFEILFQAIQSVDNGFDFFDPFVTPTVIKEFFKLRILENIEESKKKIRQPRDILTKRECEVLDHLALGQSNKKIAESLSISEKTIRNHVSRIFEKLKVNDRTQAVILAIKKGWVAI